MKLYVAVGTFKLDLTQCRSLKEKRRLIKSMVDRLGNRNIICAAEVGDNDLWKTGVLAVACVSSSSGVARGALASSRSLIESQGVEVLQERSWVFSPEDFEGTGLVTSS